MAVGSARPCSMTDLCCAWLPNCRNNSEAGIIKHCLVIKQWCENRCLSVITIPVSCARSCGAQQLLESVMQSFGRTDLETSCNF